MKNLLSKITFSVLALSLFISVPGYAQIQWNGPQNTTSPIYRSGQVGIGMSVPPRYEMLEVNGRIKLGDVHGDPITSGVLRWDGTDFQGWDGTIWKSMTSKWNTLGNNIVNNNTGHVQLGSTSFLGIGTFPHSKLEIYSIDPGTNWTTGLQLTAHYTTETPLDYITYIVQRNDGCYIRSSGYNFMSEDGNSNYLHINSNGNIGINTASPTTKLEVNGNVFINSDNASNDMLKIATDNSQNNPTVKIGVDPVTFGGTLTLAYWTGEPPGGYTTDAITLDAAGVSYINSDLGLAVGKTTITTGYKIDVAGKIRANEIVVNTTEPDFVFEDNYKLKSLNEVDHFIKENKHLPDMPTAKEVEEKGISLGEMQSKLLQKVEELTLYLIELNKENEILKKRVNELNKR